MLIEIGTGVSQDTDSFKAGENAARVAITNIEKFPLSVALIYASVHYNLEQINAGIHSIVGNVPILGTTTAGEICNGTHQHSVTVVVIASPYLSVHAAVGNRVSEDWQLALTQAVENPAISPYVKGEQNIDANLTSSGKSLFAMIFYPGNTRTASSMGYELLETFKHVSLGRIPIFGGAAADDWRMESNSVFLGDHVYNDSILVAIFETQLEVGISLSHGFQPIGQKMTVTAAEGHELLALDRTAAADTMASCMGKTREDLEGKHISLTTGYFIGSPDPMNQYSVNVATYFTPRGGVRMTQPVSIGAELTLLVNDADNSALGGSEAVRKSMIRAGTNSPALIVVHYCALRPRIMGEVLAQVEINKLLEIAGPAPTVGFFSFGEDAVADDGVSRHNNGAVAVLVLGNQFSASAKVAQENKRLLRQIEEQERANAANLSRIMFENSPTAMIAIDPNNGRIVQANDFSLKLLGYNRDEILSKSLAEITYPEDRAGSKNLYERLSNQIVDKLSYEKRYLRKDGSFFWGEVNVSALRDDQGKPSLFIGNAIDITERKNASNALRESEEKLRGLFELSPLGIALNDMSGHFIEFNEAFRNICGYSTEELNALDYWALTPKKYETDEALQLKSLKETGHYGPYVKEYIRKDGSLIPVLLNGLLITGNEGHSYIWSIVEDISKRQKMLADLLESEERFRQMFERHSAVMLLIEPQSGIIVDANPAAAQFYGYPLIYLRGMEISSINLQSETKTANKIQQALIEEQNYFVFNHRLANGEVRTVEVHSSPVSFKGKSLLFSIIHDITDRKLAEEQIRHLAFYDSLTKVPNRRLLNDRLEQTIAASKRNSRYGALMFLDLDNFKPLNDVYGHNVGDSLLIEVARRIGRCIRETDTVARFGGDEFVVMLSELAEDQLESKARASVVAEKIRTSLSQPYRLAVQKDSDAELIVEHQCTSSIGVVIFNHQTSRDDILKWADMAMYEAKNAGRNCVVFNTQLQKNGHG